MPGENLEAVFAELIEEGTRRARPWLIGSGILILVCIAAIILLSK